MSTALHSTLPQSAPSATSSLEALTELESFAFDSVRLGRQYRVADKQFGVRRGWLVVTAECEPSAEERVDTSFGEPGLWRTVIDSTSATPSRVFEVPAAVFAGEARGASTCSPGRLRELVAWALTTEAALVPDDWSPPDATQVAAWAPAADLAVRAGAVVRQGHVVNESHQLAVRFPLSTAPVEELPAARAAWLRALLVDAQRHWRLVRFGSDTHHVHAEVDLSGAPAWAFEPLLRAAVVALRCAVRWLVRSVDFLVDASASSRALEVLAPS